MSGRGVGGEGEGCPCLLMARSHVVMVRKIGGKQEQTPSSRL